jgi:hypothetical protein
MKVSSIKKAVESYNLETLKEMELELTEGTTPSHEVEGKDEGEQMTHVLAAIWIKEQIAANKSDFKTELRNYSKRVRTSLS